MQRLKNSLPALAFVFGGGLVLAQSAGVSRSFPYVGYLEENGVAVSGTRDVSLDLFTAASGGTACKSSTFSAVTVSAGRFQIEVTSVPDACLVTGELYATLAIGAAGGTKTALTTSSGARSRISSVPFALANDKAGSFLAGTNGGILFERLGGQTKLFGDTTGATGVILQPLTDIASTSALLLVTLLWLVVTGCWLGYVWAGSTSPQSKWGSSAWVIIAMAVVAAILTGDGDE